jgi:hypothetical protein
MDPDEREGKMSQSYVRLGSAEHSPAVVSTTKRFLSDLEIEASYGIPRKTLQNWRVLGRGPIYKKFGKSVRYDVRSLEAFLDSLPSGGAGIPASLVRNAKQNG